MSEEFEKFKKAVKVIVNTPKPKKRKPKSKPKKKKTKKKLTEAENYGEFYKPYEWS